MLEGNEEKVVLKELQREPVKKANFFMQIFKEFLEKLNLKLLYHLDSMAKRNALELKQMVVF